MLVNQKYLAWSVLTIFVISSSFSFLLSSVHTEVCDTPLCQELSKTYQRYMNDSADPCDDFYEYACGNYGKYHRLADGEQMIASFSIRNTEMEHEINDAIQNAANSKSHAVQFAAQLYLECNKTEKLESVGVKPLIEEINQVVGGWPMLRAKPNGSVEADAKKWPTMFAKTMARLGLSPVFSTAVQYDYLHDKRVLLMSPWTGGMNPAILSSDNHKQAYKKYMRQTAILLGAPDDEQLTADVEQVYALEESLAKEQKLQSNTKLASLASLNQLSDNRIDWVKTLNYIIDGTKSNVQHYTLHDYVVLIDEGYFAQVPQILDATPERTIQNLFGWVVAMEYGPLTTHKFRMNQLEYNSVLTGNKHEVSHWETCYNYANSKLPFAVSRVYVDTHFSPEDKKEATIMVEEIKASFKRILEQNTWLDAKTKNLALQKLAAIKENVGYADWIITDELDKYYYVLKGHKVVKDKFFETAVELAPLMLKNALDGVNTPINHTLLWPMTPVTINAAYMPPENSITIPAAILQAPFFHKDRPFTINYGTIGAIIGHEMTHGFDNTGRKYDKNGKINNWWSDATLKEFNHKTQCFVNQYSDIFIEAVKMHVNGKRTLGENIADNGGVKESFNAYQSHQAARGNSPTLPGLKLTSDQLYYLGYANTWCNVVTAEMLEELIVLDVHTPGRYRVNVPLGNQPEFSKAFQCAAGSKMNSANKCAVW